MQVSLVEELNSQFQVHGSSENEKDKEKWIIEIETTIIAEDIRTSASNATHFPYIIMKTVIVREGEKLKR